jgi:hypothetical protein
MELFIAYYRNWITFCDAWINISTGLTQGTFKSMSRPDRRDMTRTTYGV